jgi:hypothetical protein
MFKLTKSPTFTTTATLDVPTDTGVEKQTITVRFRVLGEEATQLDPVSFLRAAILNLADITDEDGTELPFGEELLDKVLSLPFARLGLVRAYWQAMAGAKLGN